MEPFLEIKPSRIAGRGVFTKKLFLPNETLCFMQGEEISLDEKNRRVLDHEEADGDSLQIDSDLFLDLFEFYRLINHSCDPNTFLRGSRELVALREIKLGEEITYDYSTTMWEEVGLPYLPLWTMECHCGSKNCRGIIAEFYKLPPILQHFYLTKGWVPDFIVKKARLVTASM